MLSNYFICSFQIDNKDLIKMYIIFCNLEIYFVLKNIYLGCQ